MKGLWYPTHQQAMKTAVSILEEARARFLRIVPDKREHGGYLVVVYTVKEWNALFPERKANNVISRTDLDRDFVYGQALRKSGGWTE